jgi:hypothetical protein
MSSGYLRCCGQNTVDKRDCGTKWLSLDTPAATTSRPSAARTARTTAVTAAATACTYVVASDGASRATVQKAAGTSATA